MSSGRVRKTKTKKPFQIIVCAHPDDETLFFGGLIQQNRTLPWLVACATDANADGMGKKRHQDFLKACKSLGVQETVFFDLPDIFDRRLDLTRLRQKLEELPPAKVVYTHGPVGEYGHPHHQDISYAVHQFYVKKARVFSCAHNAFPDRLVRLTKAQYEKKCKILSETYGSETQRFQNILPCTFTEGFCEYSMTEVEAIYRYYSQKVLPPEGVLKKHKWLRSFFAIHQNEPIGPRMF